MLDLKRIPIGAWIGLICTAAFLFAAIFAPLIAPYGLGEIVGQVWEPASDQFWLGTDNLGRDLLSRMIYGARTTIFIAAASTAISFILARCWASRPPSSAVGSTRSCRASSTS